jgi:hypothetical protein
MISDRATNGTEEAAIAAFIRTKGVTRCPTACAATTQGSVPAADRAALERYVRTREQTRRARAAASERLLFGPDEPAQAEH